jgi:TolB protein
VLVRPDGTGRKALTATPWSEHEPRWSPDAAAVAFTGDRDGNPDIYVIGADGSNLVRLTHGAAADEGPDWSPDGTRIAFTTNRDGNAEVYVMQADGSEPVNVSRSPATEDSAPSWSPDGSRIVFLRTRPGRRDLVVMAADGADQRELALPGNESHPRWSPDGARIAFVSDRDSNAEIYTVSADGSGARRLTSSPAADSAPAWAPDGTRLAFQTGRYGDDDIAVMNADGSDVRPVTAGAGSDRRPDWRPEEPRHQPDLALAPAGSAAYTGDGVVEGAQTLLATVAPGRSRAFVVRVANDGNRTDSFALRGATGGAGVRVSYRAGGRDVTRAVTSGTYVVESLQNGDSAELRLIVSVARHGNGGGNARIKIEGRSLAEPHRGDAVTLVVQPATLVRHSYGWPLRPFAEQHPIRGMFGDPRIARRTGAPPGTAFHFGIDLGAPPGTPVYAVATGFVFIPPDRPGHITVFRADGSMVIYWHLPAAVASGQLAIANRTILGYIERDHEHVHFAESRGGRVINPMRRGGMGPYVDDTAPVVLAVRFERDGRRVRSPLRDALDIVAESHDPPPIAPSSPWHGALYAPALVKWRVVGARGRAHRSWTTVFDVRTRLPATAFSSIFAPGTDQNRPNRPARYRFYLARGWESRRLRDGEYVLEVRVTDIRGNSTTHREPFEVENPPLGEPA